MGGTYKVDYMRARFRGWQLVGGRRRHNAVRRFRASLRRVQVARLLLEIGMGHGFITEVARRLGVHRGTISRDVSRLHRDWEARKGMSATGPTHDPAELEIAATIAREAWQSGIAAGRPPRTQPASHTPAVPKPRSAACVEHPVPPAQDSIARPIHDMPVQQPCSPRWLPDRRRPPSKRFPLECSVRRQTSYVVQAA